ncbi:hypothetical protein PIB30_077714 [Stylosanthes scabra]|uniref:Uncharacterized protein n=1 Tax=Stylosanthes scabra TaxID=79078 RepID=A0ABU6SQR5_9FABA|nr:hypothetical protein [Stylosanthes scabra]
MPTSVLVHRLLHDPRGVQLLDDVPAVANEAREPIVLPHDAPARGRRARMQRPDIRRPGEGTSTSERSDAQPGGDDGDEEAEYHRQEDIPAREQGDGDAPHEPDLDFFSGADIELARIILQGEGSSSGTAPQAAGAGPSFNRFGPTNEMYDVFSCGEQTMDHIVHEYRASSAAEDAVYRPGPPLQPHHDPEEQSHQQFQPPFGYHTPSPQPQLYASASQSSPLPPHNDPSYHSAPESSPHQIVRPRAQRPQRDRQPPPCGTSSRLHHRPTRGGNWD